MFRVLIHLVLLPLMLMRSSPVHTYLLDEVIVGMISGQNTGRYAAAFHQPADCSHSESPAGDESWSPVPEDAQQDPLKAPTVKPPVPTGPECSLFCWSMPVLDHITLDLRDATSSICAEYRPGDPPDRMLPLLI